MCECRRSKSRGKEGIDINDILEKSVKKSASEFIPKISDAARQAADAAADRVAKQFEQRFFAVEGDVKNQEGRINTLEEDVKALKSAAASSKDGP